MHIQRPATWPQTTAEAVALQNTLRSQVIVHDRLEKVRSVAGLDVGLAADKTRMRGAIALLDFPALGLREQAQALRTATFPYIPGLLSFREVPVLLDALEKLTMVPDLLLCDGQGLAHPRRFGIACHLGVLTGLPAIGVAKSLLVGHYENLPDARGAWRPLLYQVTAFTVAHSITLALSLYGVLSLPASVVEPLIARSIAGLAIEQSEQRAVSGNCGGNGPAIHE